MLCIDILRGAGRDGKNFLAALQPHFRKQVRALCDIDPEKIKRGYSCPALDIQHMPIVHFKEAVRKQPVPRPQLQRSSTSTVANACSVS